MAQAARVSDEARRNERRGPEQGRFETPVPSASTNRPVIQSNPRTVTTSREPNPTDAYAPTLSPTRAMGRGSPSSGPTDDEIRRRAYEIYQSRGADPGRELEDWAQAERELREKRKATR